MNSSQSPVPNFVFVNLYYSLKDIKSCIKLQTPPILDFTLTQTFSNSIRLGKEGQIHSQLRNSVFRKRDIYTQVRIGTKPIVYLSVGFLKVLPSIYPEV